MLNQYFNNYNASNEQDLTESMIIEAIQIKGIEMKYIPRTHNNFDQLLGEDPTSSFTSLQSIEMYLTDVDGFGGDSAIFSNFGIDIAQTATFQVAKKRFEATYPLEIRPSEGDLLFMPITNALLEIKFVEAESPFFQHGRQYVWELKTELYTHSYENFATGDTEVDSLLDSLVPADPSIDTEAYGDNDFIESEVSSKIEFDPNNPFGV